MISRRLFIPAAAMAMGILASTGAFLLPRLEAGADRLTDVLSTTIETRGIDAAVAQYRHLRGQGFPGLRERESDTNSLGYALLRKGDKESAIRVFQLNVETHPGSANVYDSLGEAYAADGRKDLAIESYEKALAVSPHKKSAQVALQKLDNRERPPYRPMVLFHITAGLVSLLSGAVAMALRKGSRRHGLAGSVFAASMLTMSASGAFMAFVAPDGEALNVLMGVFTFYLVATAWVTARRRSAQTGLFDWAALLVVLAVAASLLKHGLEAASEGSGFAGVFFFFGALALLAAALDARMIARGGVSGAPRVARHLWRMCTALFIAVGSLFLGQPQLFPAALRRSGLLAVPSLLVFILLVFWLIRVLFTSAFGNRAPRRPRTAAAMVDPQGGPLPGAAR
jgi:tetratricopeptide (TPR) repeat protein